MKTRDLTHNPSSVVETVQRYFSQRRLSDEFELLAEASQGRYVEQAHVGLKLVDRRANLVSEEPVFLGLYSAGRASQFIPSWFDGDYFNEVRLSESAIISLDEGGHDEALFKLLGGLIRPGGSLMVSYTMFERESRIHTDTKSALNRGYPAAATPIGFLLLTAGCGMGFKDWYFAEGGREGPEKLQGYKPLNINIERTRKDQMLQELREFATKMQGESDPLARSCKSRAELVINQLQTCVG